MVPNYERMKTNFDIRLTQASPAFLQWLVVTRVLNIVGFIAELRANEWLDAIFWTKYDLEFDPRHPAVSPATDNPAIACESNHSS